VEEDLIQALDQETAFWSDVGLYRKELLPEISSVSGLIQGLP